MRVTLVNENTIVSPRDRGLQYGDGFFTTARIANKKMVFEAEHISRLINSAHQLSFNGFNIEAINQCLKHLPQQGIVKIVVTREQSQRGYGVNNNASINALVYVFDTDISVNQSIHATWTNVPLSKNEFLGGLKHLNRLDNVMARTQVEQNGFAEGIMLDHKKVICGTQSNIFCIKNNRLMTPIISDCGVEGVVRNKILSWSRDESIEHEECEINKEKLETADAIFFTNCVKGVMAVEYIEQSRFQSHPFIALFQKLFLKELE
ncbi:MAG: aminodeoxychorismate lyase [Gammaproteobacteria bacterium]|nr:aminodeoxychorismate lyase [Gammaproteobacteria bacterium]